MFSRIFSQCLMLSLFLCFFQNSYSFNLPLSWDPKIRTFINTLAKEDNFDRRELIRLFNHTHLQKEIIQAKSAPFEARPWYIYKERFLNPERIQAGVKFWEEHEATLKEIETTYGVPANMIIAILGIETFYGNKQGDYRVMDALTTLAFHYPPRATFFKKELRHFLLLTREQGMDPLSIKGSYAGAIGQPQFMPSSYRSYAVDYHQKGYSDLINNADDIMASIANYFKKHGWKKDEPLASLATFDGQEKNHIITKKTNKLKAIYSQEQIKNWGLIPLESQKIDPSLPANFLILDAGNKNEYWLTYPNFYVITTYNTSELYALAAVELSEALTRAKKEKQGVND